VPQFLLSICQPEGVVPDSESLARVTTDFDRGRPGAHSSTFRGG
jgi:hypothetical protein